MQLIPVKHWTSISQWLLGNLMGTLNLRRSTPWVTTGLLWCLPVFLTAFYILPFLGVAGWSFTRPDLGMQNYTRVFTGQDFQSILIRTLRICLITTVFTVVIAYLLTYYWIMGTPTRRRFIELCIFIPFWISVLVRSFGWIVIFQTSGLANTFLMSSGLIDEPLGIGRSELAVIVGMVHFMIPFSVFPMATVMRKIDHKVLLAGFGLGASRTGVFWRIYFPLSLPGIYAATVMVFVFALGFFVTPTLLGGGRVVMTAESVFVQMFQTANWGVGAALSVVLLVIVGLILMVFQKVVNIKSMME